MVAARLKISGAKKPATLLAKGAVCLRFRKRKGMDATLRRKRPPQRRRTYGPMYCPVNRAVAAVGSGMAFCGQHAGIPTYFVGILANRRSIVPLIRGAATIALEELVKGLGIQWMGRGRLGLA